MSDPGFVAAKANLPLPTYGKESHPGGMLFVLSTAKGSEVNEDKFNTWYDTDHAPLRRSCQGILNARRYQATDSKLPDWLAAYELESVDVLESEAYKSQWAGMPDWEKNMLRGLTTLDRRVYRFLSRKTADDYASRAKQGHIFQYVGLEPSAQLGTEELDRWYDEEHIPLLSTVPGWLRSTRWELADAKGAAGSRPNSNEGKLPQFMAIHEWESSERFAHPEFKRAISTEWRNSVMERQNKDKEERRSWQLYKEWE
jgi:hypothetical protein